jgi:hypothetical protein
LSNTEHFYAASPLRSGIYHFTNEADRASWIKDHDGFAVPGHRVDPEVRMQYEDSTVRDVNGVTGGLFG